MADPKAHQLYKQIGSTLFTVGVSVDATTSSGGGWEVITDDVVANRTYIDLQGWTAQDLTTFVQGVDIQKSVLPLKTVGGQFDIIWEFDILSTRKLSDVELTNIAFSNTPGFAPSTVDLMEVIYGERMQYGINATITNTFVQISGETWGSGNAVATDKLHWTRVIALGNSAPTDAVTIYPANLVVQAMTVEEKDLVYMERLRRSFVLQNEIVG